jgi:O-antigen/teichoic acid export membrane protein
MSAEEISPREMTELLPAGSEQALPAQQTLSLRSNFAWAMTGNTVFAACQWGMIVALAKFGSAFMVGQFSLGLAIVTPVFMLSNLDLRAVQATDAVREYHFAEYLRLRLTLTFVAFAVIAAIVWFGTYERVTAGVILAVAMAKAIETVSDIHYGVFQLNNRLDQTGRSMILRGALAVAALSGGLYVTHNIVWACLWVALVWLASLLLFDVRRGRRLVARTETPSAAPRDAWWRQVRLAWLAAPMGAVTTIASINLHMPRYFIHARMGEHQLGIFSALAYATVALTLIGDSLGNSAIPRLSALYASGERSEYRRLIIRMLVVGTAIGLFGLATAWGFGARLIAIFYSAEYAAYSGVFTLLVAAAAIHFAASMLTSAITSARSFAIQTPLYLLVAGSIALGCARWTPTLGLTGAALGVVCGAVMRLLLAAIILHFLLVPEGRPDLQLAGDV